MQTWLSQHIPVLVSTTASAGAVGCAVAWWVLSHRKSAEEKERERREKLVQHGRIIDGSVLDWSDQPNSSDLGTLHYRYYIAGVSYECAQDLAFLKGTALIDATCLGRPASVRYDTKNPANSIIVAEGWSGLQHPKGPLVSDSAEVADTQPAAPPAVN